MYACMEIRPIEFKHMAEHSCACTLRTHSLVDSMQAIWTSTVAYRSLAVSASFRGMVQLTNFVRLLVFPYWSMAGWLGAYPREPRGVLQGFSPGKSRRTSIGRKKERLIPFHFCLGFGKVHSGLLTA